MIKDTALAFECGEIDITEMYADYMFKIKFIPTLFAWNIIIKFKFDFFFILWYNLCRKAGEVENYGGWLDL